MSFLLTEPTTILVVSSSERVLDAISTAAENAGGTTVSVENPDTIDTHLDDRWDIGCAVVADDLGEDTLVSVCRSIRDTNPRLPIVAAIEAPELAFGATDAGAEDVLSRPIDVDALGERLSDCFERFEQRRRDAAERSMFNSLLEQSRESIYAKDSEGRHVRKSATAGDIPPEEFVGQTDVDIYGDNQTNRDSLADDQRVASEGEPIYDKEESYEVASGQRWSRTTKLPWTFDGSIVGSIGKTRDVTDTVRQRNRLERHEERFEEFTRYVTHDLRNPLEVVQGSIRLARETGDEEHLERASDALERIEDIVEDISTMVREETSSVDDGIDTDDDHVRSPPSLSSLVDEVWSGVATDAATLRSEFKGPALVPLPESTVRPVIQNLLANAVEHGATGPDNSVTVRVGPIGDGGWFVADDGPGIPSDVQETIFDDGYTTAEDGTGTGLSIVSEIAERNEWALEITESWAGGARFEVRNCTLIDDPTIDASEGSPLSLETDVSVGEPDVDGRVDRSEPGQITIEGGGRNIWGDVNEFHFTYATVTGPVRIVARVDHFDNVSPWSAGGLMVRSGLDTEATYGFAGSSGEHGLGLLWRTKRGEPGVSQHLEGLSDAMSWYRLDRVGDTITAFCSADGEEWYPVDQRQVDLDEAVQVGLAVCSNIAGERTEVTFADLRAVSLITE